MTAERAGYAIMFNHLTETYPLLSPKSKDMRDVGDTQYRFLYAKSRTKGGN
jgi:hypothetical protein